MDHRLPKAGLAFSAVCLVLAAITFAYLNQAFEGPSLTRALEGERYELEARFADTEALPTKQPVLVRGVDVGKVTAVDYDHASSTATVRFTVEEEFRPVHRDASATIGERTLLGDPYLNLDPGSEGAGELEPGGEVEGLESVDFDEALDFLDADGRRDLRSLLSELRDASRAEDSGERLNVTLAELARTTGELRDLTDTLRGQEDELAGLVRDGAVVLRAIGDREASLRRIVGSGRAALDALASGSQSLERGVAELPGVLDAGRRALAGARPLLREARPVLAELRRVGPDLAAILSEVGPIAGDSVDAVAGLAAVPSLRRVLRVVTLVRPLAPKLAPAARNLVTALRYTAPRAAGITAFFANMASATAHRDSTAHWARFAILFEPGELDDNPTPAVCEPEDDVPANAGFCHNAYPAPGDAADPEPYQRGSYPRLEAFDPPGR